MPLPPALIPLLAAGVESAAFAAFDLFTTSSSEQLISEQQQINTQNRLRASGVFSDEDISTIMRDYNDQVNQFAGSVAARGLGSSAVGASLISKAQQAPFFQAQRQAAKQYQAGLSTLGSLIRQDREIKARQRKRIGGFAKLAFEFGVDKFGGEE